jgi:hypothetical protein
MKQRNCIVKPIPADLHELIGNTEGARAARNGPAEE